MTKPEEKPRRRHTTFELTNSFFVCSHLLFRADLMDVNGRLDRNFQLSDHPSMVGERRGGGDPSIAMDAIDRAKHAILSTSWKQKRLSRSRKNFPVVRTASTTPQDST